MIAIIKSVVSLFLLFWPIPVGFRQLFTGCRMIYKTNNDKTVNVIVMFAGSQNKSRV